MRNLVIKLIYIYMKFLQFWALEISFLVRNITHESCIKVGILVCGWCQAICSQSKVLIKTFPRWLPHTPFLLMYLSMYWKAFIRYSLNLKGNSHPAPKPYGWPAHPTIIWLVYLNGHDHQIASKSNWLDSEWSCHTQDVLGKPCGHRTVVTKHPSDYKLCVRVKYPMSALFSQGDHQM